MTGPTDAELAASYARAHGLHPASWVAPLTDYTDNALADRVTHHWMVGHWKWCPELGWRCWRGKVWADRNSADVLELVGTYTRALLVNALERLTAATKNGDQAAMDQAAKLVKAASAYQATVKIAAVAKLLPGRCRCEASDYDAHPDLLNVGNGVVDLRSGELLPHDAALMLSKITQVDYLPGARHLLWTKALTSVSGEVADYLRRRIGQGATGYPPEDAVVLVLHGQGENGKSALLAGIQRALGEHASYVAEQVLLAQPGGAHTTETMDLMGARLAVHEELPDGRHLDMKRIKAATSPTMKARRMRSDPVQFATSHTLVISTNYRPQVAETDHGTWRRLVLVDFPLRYRKDTEALEGPLDRRGDPRIIRELVNGTELLPAVLAWVVSGATDWYANGMLAPAPPAEVADATAAWRGSVDKLGEFIESCLIAEVGWHIASTELAASFNAYTSGANWSEQTLADRLRQHRLLPEGVTKRRTRRPVPGGTAPSQPSRPENVGSWLNLPQLPPTYAAWHGLRFATLGDGLATEVDNVRPLRP